MSARSWYLSSVASLLGLARAAAAQPPFATAVVQFDPAPGQWVNDPTYLDPARAVGPPLGEDPAEPNNSSLVSLGGFGGTLVLAFDAQVRDDPANPFGLDAIVFGNALWVSGNPNRRWAECGIIEISRDANANGVADDAWYVIAGSHLADLPAAWTVRTWDDDLQNATWPPTSPPADEAWIPPGQAGIWTTEGYRLPAMFEQPVLVNPNGVDAVREGVFGYADFTPTQPLPSGADAWDFYTRPDNPFVVGLTPGSAGGDAFDLAWAVDEVTGLPAGLDRFDFIRVRTAGDVVWLNPPLGELSTEIDAVADVAEGALGDTENDGDVDGDDFRLVQECVTGPTGVYPPAPCRVLDFDQDRDLDLRDEIAFQAAFTGAGEGGP